MPQTFSSIENIHKVGAETMAAYEKIKLDISEVESVVRNHFGARVSVIVPMEGGNLSSVYSFEHEGRGYVVKFSDMQGAYELEPIISRLLSSQGVPFPRCVGQGKFGKYNFMISERMVGDIFINCSAEQRSNLLPELMRLLTRMNHVDLGETSGFGWITTTGNGAFKSWNEYMVASFAEDQTGTFWEDWYDLFDTTYLEKDVFHECYSRLMEYSAFNAPHRYFIHGDFHPWNILSDGQRITGIIDGNFAYGDFLVDLSVLDRHMQEVDVVQVYQDYQEQSNIMIPNFKERLIGAYYLKGLDGLRFYAKMGHRDAYYNLRSFLLNLIN